MRWAGEGKFEIRSPKFETNSNDKYRIGENSTDPFSASTFAMERRLLPDLDPEANRGDRPRLPTVCARG
jgi:hypothetical protein